MLTSKSLHVTGGTEDEGDNNLAGSSSLGQRD